MSLTMKFNPRELMGQAIKVMRDSVNEPREDGKASPLVGAVLFKPDGTIDTACRGELRYGDHAEYTLLERKNRDVRLDGSILFATLEPCAPGSRAHPKLPCAERIVLARIKEVWIGIADPDPTVDRKGIKYLQNHGVTVHMFDRDLQEVIRAENKEFIDQALERAAAAEEEPERIVLTELETAVAAVQISDFSTEALEEYRTRANITDPVKSAAFTRRLVRQGVLEERDGQPLPTGFGILLFGQEPRAVIHHAGLLGTIHYPDGTHETREFDKPLVLIPDLIEEWLRNKLPNVIDRDQMRRAEVPPLPFEMVREAVVNALVHRDYAITGAKCQLVVDEHTIVVKSPGKPPLPVTVEQLQKFNAPMLSRNPGLHYVFAKMEMAEESGLGIQSLKAEAEKAGLPLPKYVFNDPYLELTLYRSKEATVRTLSQEVLDSLSDSEQAGWEWLSTTGGASSSEYASALQVADRTARRHLNHFLEQGMVRKVRSGPYTAYEVI